MKATGRWIIACQPTEIAGLPICDNNFPCYKKTDKKQQVIAVNEKE